MQHAEARGEAGTETGRADRPADGAEGLSSVLNAASKGREGGGKRLPWYRAGAEELVHPWQVVCLLVRRRRLAVLICPFHGPHATLRRFNGPLKQPPTTTTPCNAAFRLVLRAPIRPRCKDGGGGAGVSELSEGAGGTFGRLTPVNTATCQELLDCNHSQAHNFKKEQERGTMEIGV